MVHRRTILSGASEDRFQKLIEERLHPEADKEKIDERIWDLFGEVWCIMFTDLSGFSRGVAKFGIIHFLQTIYEAERLLTPVIDEFDGILLKTEGDSFLVIFKKVSKALKAALKMQKVLARYNVDRVEEEQVLLCVGLGYGKVLKIGDSDVFGAEVNAASKLGEDTAEAGEILITDTIRNMLKNVQGVSFEQIDTVPPGASGAYRVLYKL